MIQSCIVSRIRNFTSPYSVLSFPDKLTFRSYSAPSSSRLCRESYSSKNCYSQVLSSLDPLTVGIPVLRMLGKNPCSRNAKSTITFCRQNRRYSPLLTS